jgi:hypothetical protein
VPASSISIDLRLQIVRAVEAALRHQPVAGDQADAAARATGDAGPAEQAAPGRAGAGARPPPPGAAHGEVELFQEWLKAERPAPSTQSERVRLVTFGEVESAAAERLHGARPSEVGELGEVESAAAPKNAWARLTYGISWHLQPVPQEQANHLPVVSRGWWKLVARVPEHGGRDQAARSSAAGG